MTPDSIRLVRNTFAQIEPAASLTMTTFYDRLFVLDPSLRPMFAGDLGPQKHALMAALAAAVERLDRSAELVPMAQQLGVRHARYGVQPGHYATAGEALLWTFEQRLGPAFTNEARSAWIEVLGVIATTMLDAAGQIYASEVDAAND